MINSVTLIGNLGSDPELRYTANQTAVATLSVATTRKWKDKAGNKQEEVEWHRVIVWSQSAEFCGKYLQKGSKVYVEGRLQTRQWDKDGTKMYTTEIIANTVQNLSPRTDTQGGYPEPPPMGGTGEDVPF